MNALTIDSSPSGAIDGTIGGGVWQSLDGGSSWQPTGLSAGVINSLAMDSAGILYAGTGFAEAQVSRDGGTTWTDLDPGLRGLNDSDYGLAIDPSDSRKIFLSSTAAGLIVSQDGGANWALAGQGFGSGQARQVVFDPSNSQRIYAGSFYTGGLFKSEDGGFTWSTQVRVGSRVRLCRRQ